MTDKKYPQNDNSDRDSPLGYQSESVVNKLNQITSMHRVDSENDFNLETANQQKHNSWYELKNRAKTFGEIVNANSRACAAQREMSPAEWLNPRQFSIGECPPIDSEQNRENST